MALAIPVSHAQTTPQVVEVGTVSTIAGPDFCPQRAIVDRAWSSVRALAVDPSGNIYFDTGRTDQGVVGTIDPEGNASLVPTGFAGPPRSSGRGSGLSPPARLASDGAGGVFMAVPAGVLHLHEAGGVGIFAGDVGRSRLPPGADPVGDGGSPRGARFVAVASLASDAGNLFVAERVDDTGALRIRMVNRGAQPLTFYGGTPHQVTVAPGAIATIAGHPGGPPASRRIRGRAPAMAVAGSALYLTATTGERGSDTEATAVTVLNLGAEPLRVHGVTVASGAAETVAGGGPAGFGGDGGPARRAAFSAITGMTTDASGSLFLADPGNHRVRKVDAAGTVTTFVGSGATGVNAGGFNGNGRPATEARLNRPSDVKAGVDGRIYISDQLNDQLRFVDEAGVIHAARGNGVGITWRCSGVSDAAAQAPPASLSVGPTSVASDATNLFFTVPAPGGLKQVTSAGSVAAVPQGRRFPSPKAVAVEGGILYVLDGVVYLVNQGPAPVAAHGVTVPARGSRALGGEKGPERPGTALPVELVSPGSVAVAAHSDLFFSDTGDSIAGRVRHVSPRGEAGELSARGCCGQPAGLAVDASGNLYVSSSSPPRVWVVNRGPRELRANGQRVAPGAAAVVAGTGRSGFAGDGGPAVDAELLAPRGVAVDGEGNLYVADAREHSVRKVDRSGVITTAMGTGTAGFNGDGLKPALTALNTPTDVAVDSCGNLIVADSGNRRVRRVNAVPSCGAAPPAERKSTSIVPVLVVALVAGAILGGGVTVALSRRHSRRPRRPSAHLQE